MLKDVFNINSFNVYSDDKYYYFFRALEELDIDRMSDKTIMNPDGTLSRLMTDREYYGETKYSVNQEISLKEMFDHIKMHYDRHTNCISFTSNANCALVYGRQTYDDQYVMMRVPKEELGNKTYQAGLYMLEEINKKINEILEKYDLEDYEMQKYYFDYIDNADNQEALDRLKEMLPKKNKTDNSMFEEGLSLNPTESLSYQSLNKEQNFQKNKIIMKLDILNRNLIPGISNNFLIQTVGNAFSSTEIIHYKDVDGKNLTLLSKEIVDLMGLIQQIPKDMPNVEEIKRIILDKSFSTTFDENINYRDFSLVEDNFNIENMYNLTNGNVNYKTAKTLYEKAFYLAKAKIRAKNSVKLLKKVLNNDSRYTEIYDYLDKKSFGIEPELTTKLTGNFYNLSESISLDLNKQEQGLVEYINELDYVELENIINNPQDSLTKLLTRFTTKDDQIDITKEEWIANAIIDNFDWEKIGVKENLSLLQREDIINKLYENDFINKYNSLKGKGLSLKEISYSLFYTIIRKKEVDSFNSIKDSLSLEEIEWFIGYNKIKGTNINLRYYQKTALKNINELFEDRQFAAAILPTGAGKSYVALAEIYERLLKNPNEKILYLAPNVEILNQFKGIMRDVYKPEEHLGDNLDRIIKRTFPNLTFTTYQDLRNLKTDEIKSKYSDDYDFIIFDELHRTGASKWQDTVEALVDNQKKKIRILGLTATPKRDYDFKNMVDYWGHKYGYSEKELIIGTPMASNMSLVEAIEMGIVLSPRVVLSMYSYLENGGIEEVDNYVNSVTDLDTKNHEIERLNRIRKEVENSNGIEKILHDNLNEDGKYIIFLPVNKKDNGEFEDEYGNKISKTTAEKIIKDYQLLMKQYIFSYEYLNANPVINDIYSKIQNNISLSNKEIDYLNHEKRNILLLTKIDIMNKNTSLNTDTNLIADAIINYMKWEELPTTERTKELTNKTKQKLDMYSMLGSYSNKKNSDMLANFNKDCNGKMKLMFVMNKLNEGVHAKGINGIVWLRKLDNDSLTLYFQQLGRCIKAIEPGIEWDEKDRPVVLDLVNNTLNMNFDRESKIELDLKILKEVAEWVNSNGKFPDKNKTKEASYYKLLQNIYLDYVDYLIDATLIEKLDITNKILINEILNKGSEIDLWSREFDQKEKRNKNNITSSLLDAFGVKGIERDLYEILLEVSKNKSKNFNNTFEYHLSLLKRLKEQGQSPNLSLWDKIKINEDGKIIVVKRLTKLFDGKQVQINKEEYLNPSLITTGSWLYYNQINFSEPQKQKLREVGYVLQEDIQRKDDIFEYHLSLLKRLKEQGQSPNLNSHDKIKINEDGILSIIKKVFKNVHGKQVQINKEEYLDPSLITTGNWLYINQINFSEPQKQKLREVGYVLQEDKDTINDIFEYHLNLLKRLKEQGQSVYLKSTDKIKINEDGILSIIKKVFKNVHGKQVQINKEEYLDPSLITTGNWLYINQMNFSEPQKQKLREVGYVLQEDIQTKDDTFEYYFSLLEKLKEQGESTSLLSHDKIRINEDGKLLVVKPEYKRISGKQILTNKEEYFDSGLITIGIWLYSNQNNLTKSQKDKLRAVGYVLREDKQTKDDIFEYHLSLLKRLKEQGLSPNLSQHDKIRITEDGTLSVIKREIKRRDDKLYQINKEEYLNSSLICTGQWLYLNQDKLSTNQKKKLRDIGYVLQEDKQTKDDTFEYYLSILKKLKEQGQSLNLKSTDKIRINEDETLSIIRRETKRTKEGKRILLNEEEYMDSSLIRVGYWLYKYKDTFDVYQKQKLKDVGYILEEDKKKKYKESKSSFDEESEFIKVSKKVKEDNNERKIS